MDMLNEFHFMRPEWLYALIPLALLLWLQWRRRLSGRSWQSVVEPRLLAHLLIGQSAARKPWNLAVVALGGILAIVAMAGPSWHKLEVPVFRQHSALVVLLDMSRSMDAADIKPSRLLRAQMKLRDILNQRKEGETALVVYAATPFVVSPLTSDAKTIASQLESLTTDLMPAQGSRPDRAIDMALQLLQQSGISHGGVLLISDGIDGGESDDLQEAIKHLVGAGHRLSVLGAGTPEGAPIPADGGFLKDRTGAIVLPRLDDAALDTLARQGNGSYRRIGNDDSDFNAALAPLNNPLALQQSKKAEGQNGGQWHSDQWRDEGPWLLLPLLLLGALAFRRGYVLVFLLLLLPLPHPAYASDWASGWNSLWQRDDQRGQQAMQANDPKQAALLFKNPEWRAAANYRAKDYRAAAQDLKDADSADALYNRGNALARLGQLPEAKNAYDEALKRDPNNADAKFNRDLVDKLLERQQQNQKQNGDGKDQQQGNGSNRQNRADDKNGQSQSGSDKKSSQQDGKENQQNSANQQGDKQSDAAKNEHQQSDAGQQNNAQDDAAKQQAAKQENQNNGNSENARQVSAAQKDKTDSGDKPDTADAQQDASELQQADQQWLQRIPDDPGGLWRRKFLDQYKQQPQSGKSEEKTW